MLGNVIQDEARRAHNAAETAAAAHREAARQLQRAQEAATEAKVAQPAFNYSVTDAWVHQVRLASTSAKVYC